ncbi:MAG TPA: hypothetical protein VIM62_11460, partial [Acidobacteriaceae bacterium]
MSTSVQSKKPTLWSILLVPVAIAAIMTPAILLAASGSVTNRQGFDAIVRTIELRYHAHATRIPFMGLISGIAGISTHGGVHGLHVAEFERFRADDAGDFDGAEFNDLVEKHVGPGWQRMIRETSREHDGRQGEQTLIYVRPDGKNVAMLVVNLDDNDLNVVQLSMNPDHLMDEVNEHRHHHDPESASDDDSEKQDKG